MRYCSWEGREFPDDDFELAGSQFVHKHLVPRHNSLGELVADDGGGVEPDIPPVDADIDDDFSA